MRKVTFGRVAALSRRNRNGARMCWPIETGVIKITLGVAEMTHLVHKAWLILTKPNNCLQPAVKTPTKLIRP